VIELALDPAAAPCTVQSFVTLAEAAYFDGTTCHRLTTSETLSVLQCGDPTGTGSGGPGYEFDDETTPDLTYPRGTVAMANAGPGTNGSQFFLVYGDSQLPPDYTVFGTVTAGLEVLDEIAAGGVAGGGTDGAPATPVSIATVDTQKTS
jgi:peptidyl-prolyl cis-trans isomerase B (cyclophilin B)